MPAIRMVARKNIGDDGSRYAARAATTATPTVAANPSNCHALTPPPGPKRTTADAQKRSAAADKAVARAPKR